MKKEMYKQILSILLIIGMLVSAFLTYEHFSETTSEVCKFGESFDCGIVNKSPYANLDGLSYLLTIDFNLSIPLINLSNKNVFLDFLTSNAVLGFLTLLFVLILNTRNINEDFLFVRKEDRLKWMRGILIFGLIYGGYLFYIQHYILKTYCIFCIGLDLTIIASLITVFLMKK